MVFYASYYKERLENGDRNLERLRAMSEEMKEQIASLKAAIENEEGVVTVR